MISTEQTQDSLLWLQKRTETNPNHGIYSQTLEYIGFEKFGQIRQQLECSEKFNGQVSLPIHRKRWEVVHRVCL